MPVGLLALAKKIILVFLLIFAKILSTLTVKSISFATTGLAPVIEIAWGNCRNPYSVWMASSSGSKKAWAIIDISSSYPFPKIILFLFSEYLSAMALIRSSLTCGGYLFKLFENSLRTLTASKDVPRALSFADNLIKFFLIVLPKFGL